jgi:hypothetical protein
MTPEPGHTHRRLHVHDGILGKCAPAGDWIHCRYHYEPASGLNFHPGFRLQRNSSLDRFLLGAALTTRHGCFISQCGTQATSSGTYIVMRGNTIRKSSDETLLFAFLFTLARITAVLSFLPFPNMKATPGAAQEPFCPSQLPAAHSGPSGRRPSITNQPRSCGYSQALVSRYHLGSRLES